MKPKQNPHFSPDHLCDQEYNELPGREGLGGGGGARHPSCPCLVPGWAGWTTYPPEPRCQFLFASSPGSLREEARAQLIPPCSRPRPDGGEDRVQVLQALQQLAGEMRGLGRRAEAGGQGRGF